MADIDRLWNAERLAAYLRVPKSTVYEWRRAGEGPPALLVGRHLRWRQEDVDDWLNGKREAS
jgi:excisionase family DNA binding protein